MFLLLITGTFSGTIKISGFFFVFVGLSLTTEISIIVILIWALKVFVIVTVKKMCYFRVKVNSKNVYRGQKTTSEISEIPEAGGGRRHQRHKSRPLIKHSHAAAAAPRRSDNAPCGWLWPWRSNEFIDGIIRGFVQLSTSSNTPI